MDFKDVVEDSLTSSGLVGDDNIEQLAKNIAEDIKEADDTLEEKIIELYNNGLGIGEVERLIRYLVITDKTLVDVIFVELSYWRKYDKLNTDNKSKL